MFFNYVSWSMDRRWMLALVCSPCIYRFYHHHQDDDDDDEYLTLSVNLFLFPLFCFVLFRQLHHALLCVVLSLNETNHTNTFFFRPNLFVSFFS